MNTGKDGIELIKHFEGCSLSAYLCPAYVWTIGYGHTGDVNEGDVITEHQAEALLTHDLKKFEGYVNELVEVPLEQNEFDALVAWTYNLGPGNLRRSTLLLRLNAGCYRDVPDEMRRWNKVDGRVLSGLVRRREAEARLWEGVDWREAPG